MHDVRIQSQGIIYHLIPFASILISLNLPTFPAAVANPLRADWKRTRPANRLYRPARSSHSPRRKCGTDAHLLFYRL